MANIQETTECADCGATIDSSADTPQERIPCAICGSTRRIYHVSITETLTIWDGFGMKAKRPGEKRPYVEDLSIPSFSHSKDKLVHRQRVIDRDNDKYLEKVTDYETGDVIHHCEEPLSKHQGHGSARQKNESLQSEVKDTEQEKHEGASSKIE